MFGAELINSQEPDKIMQLTEKIRKKYFHNEKCTSKSVSSIVQCMGNIYFNISMKDIADKRRKRNKALTYVYQFSFVGDEPTTTKFLRKDLDIIGNCLFASFTRYV